VSRNKRKIYKAGNIT